MARIKRIRCKICGKVASSDRHGVTFDDIASLNGFIYDNGYICSKHKPKKGVVRKEKPQKDRMTRFYKNRSKDNENNEKKNIIS